MWTNRHGKSVEPQMDSSPVISAAVRAEVREVAGEKHTRVLERVEFSYHIRHFVTLAKRGPHKDASPEEIAANWIAKSLLLNLYPHDTKRDLRLAQCLRKNLGSLGTPAAMGVLQLMRLAVLHPLLWEQAFDAPVAAV